MITPTQMYWLVTLDSIKELMVALCAISAIAIISAIICWVENDSKKAQRFAVASVAVLTIALMGVVFIPSTKQMAAIIVVPRIANSEKVASVGNRLYDLAVERMDELRPRKARSEIDKEKDNASR